MTDEPTMETMVKGLTDFGRIWSEAQQTYYNRISEVFTNMVTPVDDDDTKED